MSSSDDEDDKFLYGSDSESQVTNPKENKRKLQASEDADDHTLKRAKVSAPVTSGKEEKNESASSNESSGDDDSDSASSDEESDSDVEFIISTGTDTARLDSASTSTSVATGQQSGISVATTPSETQLEPAQPTSVTNPELTTLPAVPTGTIDLEAEGTFEGQAVTSLDPEVLKEKPWRQPGANLSDYFNYGFNEFTWMEYLHREEKLQQEYNPHKILMGLITLQQQGKLTGPNKLDSSLKSPSDNTNVMPNGTMNSHAVNRPMPPPGFPPLPMFGGFSPFGMPGMMPPMNQNQQNQQRK